MTFLEKLLMYQKATGLPHKVLATWLGVSYPTYKGMRDGLRHPSSANLTVLSTLSGISKQTWADNKAELPDPLPAIDLQLGKPGRPPRVTVSHQSKQIAARIKLIIAQHYDGNQHEFAKVIMTDETRLSRLLNGQREITEKLILKINRLTGVSADWLRTGIESPTTNLIPVQSNQHDGECLSRYLDSKGLYWADLQRLMGFSSLSSAVEYKHRKDIRYQTKIRIAQALQVSVSDVFGC